MEGDSGGDVGDGGEVRRCGGRKVCDGIICACIKSRQWWKNIVDKGISGQVQGTHRNQLGFTPLAVRFHEESLEHGPVNFDPGSRTVPQFFAVIVENSVPKTRLHAVLIIFPGVNGALS